MAMEKLIETADKNGVTLSLSVAPFENPLKSNYPIPAHGKLMDFYRSLGFKTADSGGRKDYNPEFSTYMERTPKANSVQSDAPPRNKDLNTKVEGGLVETWYDKPTRSWVSQIKDTNGNQVGSAEYTGSGRDSAKKAHDFLVGEAERRIRDNG
jgi:hypothetical protein